MSDLEQTITDAISDSQLDSTPEVDSTPVEVDSTADTSVEASTSDDSSDSDSSEVASPATRQAVAEAPETAEADEFEKKWGVPREVVPGRENRIPHSRVTKMVTKAGEEAVAKYKAEFEPKYVELESKVKAQEEHFAKVARFEDVMMNDKPFFLKSLAKLPGYDELLAPLFNPPAAQPQTPAVAPVPDGDPRPEADQELADGTVIYSHEQFEKLNEWNIRKAKKEALEEVEKIYGPIRQEREVEQRIRAVEPIVKNQIAEARKWPLFSENEDAITKALQSDPRLSLEGAYRQVVHPQLTTKMSSVQTDAQKLRQQIRAEVLAELRNAPTSSSAPVRPGMPPAPKAGKKTMEEIIAEQVATLKR